MYLVSISLLQQHKFSTTSQKRTKTSNTRFLCGLDRVKMDEAFNSRNNMIKSLTIQNFTTFSDVKLDFKNLNIIIGENGLGKSHLLKLPYAVMAASKKPHGRSTDDPTDQNHNNEHVTKNTRPTKNILEKRLTNKLFKVFRPEKRVGRLVRRKQGQDRCTISVEQENAENSISFKFSTKSNISITHHPSDWYKDTLVFLPTHELLSIYQGFTWIYDTYNLSFDETWYDTCKLLGAPTLRGRRAGRAADLSKPLEDILGGSITFDGSRFYLRQHGAKMEIPLVAEGLRKIGMLAQLINTGQLSDVGCLFWDEPESNLNPKIIRDVAKAIFAISQFGTQVFIATHSLFLLKELEILRQINKTNQQRYFVLEKKEDSVVVQQTDNIYSIKPFTMLDEESAQSDRFIEASQQ